MFVILEVLACSPADRGEELQKAIILTRSQRAVLWRGSLGCWEEVGEFGKNLAKQRKAVEVKDIDFTPVLQQQGHQCHRDPPGFVFLVGN